MKRQVYRFLMLAGPVLAVLALTRQAFAIDWLVDEPFQSATHAVNGQPTVLEFGSVALIIPAGAIAPGSEVSIQAAAFNPDNLAPGSVFPDFTYMLDLPGNGPVFRLEIQGATSDTPITLQYFPEEGWRDDHFDLLQIADDSRGQVEMGFGWPKSIANGYSKDLFFTPGAYYQFVDTDAGYADADYVAPERVPELAVPEEEPEVPASNSQWRVTNLEIREELKQVLQRIRSENNLPSGSAVEERLNASLSGIDFLSLLDNVPSKLLGDDALDNLGLPAEVRHRILRRANELIKGRLDQYSIDRREFVSAPSPPNAAAGVGHNRRIRLPNLAHQAHNMPWLTTELPEQRKQSQGPKDINIVFIHGLSLESDQFGLFPEYHYDDHWKQYAWPGKADGVVAAAVEQLKGAQANAAMSHVQEWWHFYDTCSFPIFPRPENPRPEAKGNGWFLAEALKERILNQRRDADIILVGYSMGGLVALSAYQQLIKQGWPADVIDGVITLDSPLMGSEWTNLCMDVGRIGHDEGLGRWRKFLFNFVQFGPGIEDLSSVYSFMASPDDGVSIPILRPNLRLIELQKFLAIEKHGASLDNWLIRLGGDVPRGTPVVGSAGDRLAFEKILDSDRVFNSITSYLPGQGPCPPNSVPITIDRSHSALASPATGKVLHDGIVPLHSQLRIAIDDQAAIPRFAPKNLHLNHTDVLARKGITDPVILSKPWRLLRDALAGHLNDPLQKWLREGG